MRAELCVRQLIARAHSVQELNSSSEWRELARRAQDEWPLKRALISRTLSSSDRALC